MIEGRYVSLFSSGALNERIEELRSILGSCTLCPRCCRVDRLKGERGFCAIGEIARVASYGKHYGEESVLVGRGGSGTVFFSGCNLKCVFCQNYTISCELEGIEVVPARLADIMLMLQRQGAENINWVSPTHVLPQIVEALSFAAEGGLTRPIVYNCGGYESVPVLRLLDGMIDIYMPDAKFADAAVAERLADAPDYFERALESIREMQRQVGVLKTDDRGIAERGVLVRHLVLPAQQAGSEAWADALSDVLGPGGAVNVMGQYRPLHKAYLHRHIDRRPRADELERARAAFGSKGLRIIE